MAWFNHDYLTISNGVISKTLPWYGDRQSWYDGDYELYRRNVTYYSTRWQIYDYAQDLVISVSKTTFYRFTPQDPVGFSYTNSWTVSEASAGAQGDPHIKPLFGKDYTI